MSGFLKNTFVSRRGFLSRTLRGAERAGTGAVLGVIGARRVLARDETNPWAYDVSPYLTTDPALIHYAEVQSFPSPQPNPRCLAVDARGHWWVGCGTSLVEMTDNGEVLSTFPAAQEIRALTAHETHLYVAYRDHVAVFGTDGTPQTTWESPGDKTYLTGMTTLGDEVFVADAGHRIVHRYDRSGKRLQAIGKKDPARGIAGFIVPSPFFSVAGGADGLLRVTNTGRHRVELYTPDGDLELAWGQPGMAVQNFSGCCNPIDVALLPDGRTVTFEKGIPRVKVYSATGEFECVVAGPESFEENAKVCGPNDCTLGGMDGAVLSGGRIMILDVVTAQLRVMKPTKPPAKSPQAQTDE